MPSPDLTTLELLKRLVAFDTTSRNSNLDLIAFVGDYLKGYGIDSELVHDDTGAKANLYATIGPRRDGGIVLSGHTDVVPVDGQDWDTDPFVLHNSGDRLYGRGTADMKGFCAAVLAMVPKFLSRDLSVPIHLAFSYDEEVGCIGVHGLMPHVAVPGMTPKAVIVGEPTSMRVVNAHKGIRGFRTVVTGLEAHSSATHKGVNAVMIAADLITFLLRVAEEEIAATHPNSRFDPPYTSVSVGPISGGTALNIIPKHCSFLWEYRTIPGQDEEGIYDRFTRYVNESVLPKARCVSEVADIETNSLARVPPLVPDSDESFETLIMALAGSNQTYTVSYGTEAGIFQEAGIPAVVCGPGDIMQAHRPNEFIAISEVESCRDFLHRLLDHVALD
jgi:acetylornithine deacetylase